MHRIFTTIPVFKTPDEELAFYQNAWNESKAVRNEYGKRGFETMLYEHAFYQFLKNVMFVKEKRYMLSPDIHFNLAQFLQDREHHYRLVILFRKGLKSSILRSYVIWTLIKDPTRRFLYYCSRIKLASMNLKNIAKQFEHNKELHRLWPEMKATPEHLRKAKWNREGIEVPIESQLVFHNEANIEIGSVVSGISGEHFDEVCADDAVDNINCRTAKLRQNVKEAMHELENVVLDDGYHNFAGTRWHYDDAYGAMLNEDLQISEEGKSKYQYHVYHRKAIENDKPTYPQILDIERLRVLRVRLGSYMYQCQYMCEPTSPDNAIFNMSSIRLITRAGLQKISPVNTYVFIDPANYEKNGSDRIAIPAIDIDRDGNIYIKRLVTGRFSDTKTIEHLSNFYMLFKNDPRTSILKFGMEEYAFENKYKKYLTQEIRKDNIAFRILPIPSSTTRSKAQKISSMSLFMENGQVFFVCKDDVNVNEIDIEDRDAVMKVLLPELRPAYEEAETYHPETAEHDDIWDAISNIKFFVMKANERPQEKAYKQIWQCRWCQRICEDDNAMECPECGGKLIQARTMASQANQIADEFFKELSVGGIKKNQMGNIYSGLGA